MTSGMLRVLINFATMKAGGGQNVALNFLYAVEKCNLGDVTCHYIVARGSEPHEYLLKRGTQNFTVAPRSAIARILFEALFGWVLLAYLRIDVVYSYFGYAWFPRHWPQATGAADSNLFFPEIAFWAAYPPRVRCRKWLIDRYRLAGLKRAAAVVFENEALEARARQLHDLQRTRTIKPSIRVSDSPQPFALPRALSPGCKVGLFLCGWHLNKNVLLIPDLALEFRRRNHLFAFVLTAPPDGSSLHRQFVDLASRKGVSDAIFVTGAVRKDQLRSLYEQSDFVFLLSKLESFSNNIIEAWQFRRPLVVADEPWARGICRDAAIYVNRDSAADIAERVCAALVNESRTQEIVARGSEVLREYPSIEERIEQELSYVREVVESR
jgi:glycosyltransferase involved in cell wall biosynthesis